MMGLDDIDAAKIMAVVMIALLLVSFVWRLYFGGRHESHSAQNLRRFN